MKARPIKYQPNNVLFSESIEIGKLEDNRYSLEINESEICPVVLVLDDLDACAAIASCALYNSIKELESNNK